MARKVSQYRIIDKWYKIVLKAAKWDSCASFTLKFVEKNVAKMVLFNSLVIIRQWLLFGPLGVFLQNTARTPQRGHFEVERVGPPFPLLKCLRTHYGRNYEPFSGPKCTRLQVLHMQSQFFPGAIPPPRTPAEASPVPGPIHQFPLGSPAFPLFLLYEDASRFHSSCAVFI